MDATSSYYTGAAEPIDPAERAQRIAQSKESLSRLGEQAHAADVQLALELLPRTCLGNTADELEVLLADVPSEQAGFCLDTNHLGDASQLIPTVKQLARISHTGSIHKVDWGVFVGGVGNTSGHGWDAKVEIVSRRGFEVLD